MHKHSPNPSRGHKDPEDLTNVSTRPCPFPTPSRASIFRLLALFTVGYLTVYLIMRSNYFGGDVEGPEVRNLTQPGFGQPTSLSSPSSQGAMAPSSSSSKPPPASSPSLLWSSKPPQFVANAEFDRPSSEPHVQTPSTGREKQLPPTYAIYEYKRSEPFDVDLETAFVEEPPSIFDYDQQDWLYNHSASICVERGHVDPHSYLVYNQTNVRLVWMVWLPSNGHGRNIVLGQLYHLLAPNGLAYRPHTHLYIVLLTDSLLEEKWFYSLPLFKENEVLLPIKVFQTSDNAYEFWAIRWLWELGCEHPDDIYLYFHTKGARYGALAPQYIGKRNRAEIVLSRQSLRPWRSILSLMAATRQPTISWTGGKNNNWFNFFWMKGEWIQNLLKPVRTQDRYWYEYWNGRISNNGSQCDASRNLEGAVNESIVDTEKRPFAEGLGSSWNWSRRNFYATRECKEWNGDQGYMVGAILERGWAPPSCKPQPEHDFCDNQERGAPDPPTATTKAQRKPK